MTTLYYRPESSIILTIFQLKTQEFSEFKSPDLFVIASKGWNQNMGSGGLWEGLVICLRQILLL